MIRAYWLQFMASMWFPTPLAADGFLLLLFKCPIINIDSRDQVPHMAFGIHLAFSSLGSLAFQPVFPINLLSTQKFASL